jgi:hypothetical protein
MDGTEDQHINEKLRMTNMACFYSYAESRLEKII